MMSRSNAQLRLAAVCLVACSCTLDARKQAVDEFVEFGLASPFTLIQLDADAAPGLAVADSALERYNRIFDYLPRSADIDSARYYYDHWMNVLLREGTFSAVEGIVYELVADTLVAHIAVRRPELNGFEETVLSRLNEMDAATLTERISRAKRELVVRDTLELHVLAGPRIVTWSSALRRRDSLDMELALPVAGETPPEPARPSGPQPLDRRERAAAEAGDGAEAAENLEPLADPADSTITMWIDVGNAHIRSGPGTEFAVVAVRPRGTRLVADSLAGRWYHVREVTGKVTGFIAGSLVNLEPVEPPPPPATPEPQRQTKGRVATES